MKISKCLIIATILSTIAIPAGAQTVSPVNQAAQTIGNKKLATRAWPVGHNVVSLDARKDPWVPVTSQEMAAAMGTNQNYQLTTRVDYNADGVMDIAYIAKNSRQGAVLVQLGGGKKTVVAYKASQRLLGGQEIATAGKRRIVLQFPESNLLVLSSENGRPSVYFLGDDER